MKRLIAGTHSVSLKRFLSLSAVLCFAAAISSVSVPRAPAQIRTETPAPGSNPSGCDYDQRGNYYCWGGAGKGSGDRWTAIAFSKSTFRSGTSHGQVSQSEGEQLALSNCRSGAADCKVQIWGRNTCLALAVSLTDQTWGIGNDPDRAKAETKAVTNCIAYKGKNCFVQAAPCASDDPRLPLPSPVVIPIPGADPIVGCYQWFNGGTVAIRQDHTAVGGPFTATWQVVNAAQRTYLVTWQQPVTFTVTVSADQKSLSGGNQYGGSDTATRISGSSGLVGTWKWFDVVTSTVTIKPDGTYSGVSSSATTRGTWKTINASAGTYTLTMTDLPRNNLTLTADGSRASGGDLNGKTIWTAKIGGCQ
jgi:hypothetical protein